MQYIFILSNSHLPPSQGFLFFLASPYPLAHMMLDSLLDKIIIGHSSRLILHRLTKNADYLKRETTKIGIEDFFVPEQSRFHESPTHSVLNGFDDVPRPQHGDRVWGPSYCKSSVISRFQYDRSHKSKIDTGNIQKL